VKKVAIIFIIWLFILNIFAIISVNRLNLSTDTAYSWIDSNRFSQEQGWNLVTIRNHWDGVWYTNIAKEGYFYKSPQEISNVPFFPLYPILIKIFSTITSLSVDLSGWILSISFLFLALFYFYKLLRRFHPDTDPYLAISFFLIFPSSFFLNSVYTESLFIFLSIASFYYARQNKFLIGNSFALFASLTRVTGVLLFIPLIWEFYKQNGFKKIFTVKSLSFLLIPLGPIVFFFYHYFRFGDFFLFFQAQSWFGRSFKLNPDHFSVITNPAIINLSLDIFYVITAITISLFILFKIRTSYGLYMLTTIFVALSTGTLMSIGRYILPLFPIFIFFAQIKNTSTRFGIALTSSLLLALNIILFVNNYWAG
jgi:Gpi18-like mannosyltransferase